MKKKYYVVTKNNEKEIFDNWDEAKKASSGISGATPKGFSSKEAAEQFIAGKDSWSEKIKKECDDETVIAFPAGSCNEEKTRYSYGVQFVLPGNREDHIYNFGNNEIFKGSYSIVGEILGTLQAFDYAIAKKYNKINIYHNSEGIEKWATGDWKSNNKAAKFYSKKFQEKYKDLLDIKFEKIPNDENITYKNKARLLARKALLDREKHLIMGDNWFTIPNISEEEFKTILSIINELDSNIEFTNSSNDQREIFKITHNRMAVTATLYSGGYSKLLLQGKNNDLFKLITSTIIELTDATSVESLISDAFKISIDKDTVAEQFTPIEQSLPNNYPDGIKRLLKQSIINLTHTFQSEDYCQYAYPALRALEGHIKYLITVAGGNISGTFNCFNKDSSGLYCVSQNFPDTSKNDSIANCYNYYKSKRDRYFHFGDIIGPTDNTAYLSSKPEADAIIQDCINLIKSEL